MKPRIEILPLLLTILGMIVLCMLGYWQLQRLEWKQNLLAALDRAYAQDAFAATLNPQDLDGDFDFRRGQLQGRLMPEYLLELTPRPREREMGRDLYMPLRLEDGSHILVNLGWAPLSWDLQNLRVTGDNTDVAGLIKRPPARNIFSPPGTIDQGRIYFLDLETLAASWELERLRPYILMAEAPIGSEETSYPRPYTQRPDLNNNHAYYAAFWFSMAAVMLVIYGLRFHVKKR